MLIVVTPDIALDSANTIEEGGGEILRGEGYTQKARAWFESWGVYAEFFVGSSGLGPRGTYP